MVSCGLDMSVRGWRLQKRVFWRGGSLGGGIRIVAAYAYDLAAIGFDGCHC